MAPPPDGKGRESVQVVVRCRPFSEKERQEGHGNVVTIDKAHGAVTIDETAGPRTFSFDAVFDGTSEQMQVYNQCARHLIDSALEGFNSTIFAYGQTGTGKTHSMEGVRDDPALRGIIPNAFEQIFGHIQLLSDTGSQFLIRASYLEIYNEDIWDLLNPRAGKLELKERPDAGVYVRNLSLHIIKNTAEAYALMAAGNANRSTAATNMNARSSRSHSIFTITIERSERSAADGEEHIRVGKLNLVDLAGSERQSKTGATGDRLKEAAKINLSLTALGNVISALVDGKSSHIPYRDSKLTRLLQDSLGGNARTLMIATLSPASYNMDETLSTLRYANRAKNIKNKPKINEDPKDAMLREFQAEIERLQHELSSFESGSAPVTEPGERRKRRSGTAKARRSRESGDAASRSHKGVSEAGLREMEQALDQEKQALLESAQMAEDEKQRLLEEVEQRAAEVERERQARDKLARKLSSLQERLLVGGENLVDKAATQRALLERQEADLAEQQRREAELQRELAQQDAAKMHAEGQYSSLQEEVQAKTVKLQRVSGMVTGLQDDMKDFEANWIREKEMLLDTVRDLARDLKLQLAILAAYVPDKELSLVESLAEFDAGSETWHIPHLHSTGNALAERRRQQMARASDSSNVDDALALDLSSAAGRRLQARISHPEWYAPLPGVSGSRHLGSWTPQCVFGNVFIGGVSGS